MTLRTVPSAILVAAALVTAADAATGASRATPTLQITPRTVAYGSASVVLSGAVPSRRAGESVTILAHACRFTEAAEIATVRTSKGGAFRYKIRPMLNTSFAVRWNEAASRSVRVTVEPTIVLSRVGAGRYRIEVATTNGVFQDGRQVLLQRSVGGRWTKVAAGTLERASGETQITVLSAVVLSANVPKGSKLRALLPNGQARCYRGGTSPEIVS